MEMLNSTEKISVEQGLKLFSYEQTTESLRVTLMVMLEITEFLLDQGTHYVLTAKLNQDHLAVRIYCLYCECWAVSDDVGFSLTNFLF